jgi:uncharacterized protein (TIGR02266 family)
MANRYRSRRRHRRLTVRIDVEYATSEIHGRAQATTLGAGGLFIATETPLPPGTVIAVSFSLPGSAQRHRIVGHVVWRQSPGGRAGPAPGMGIAFKDPAAAGALAAELEATPSPAERP